MTVTPTTLEPAVGRLLVTLNFSVWAITKVYPNGHLDLADPFSTVTDSDDVPYEPEQGEWVATDMGALRVYARLMGRTLT